MAFNTEGFTSNIVAVTVGVIIVTSVAIPVITSATTGMSAGNVKTILEMLPVFLCIALLLACITLFVSKRKNQ